MLNSNSCVVYSDSISDPVCNDCYLKQTRLLLNEINFYSIYSKDILKKLENKFPIETMNDTSCIFCDKGTLFMCHYCFSIIINKILKEFNFSKDLIEEFGCHSDYY
jgi:hypothetical protein